MSPRDGVILAAGFGSRLHHGLKPLTPVAGVPLLFRAVRSLEISGCEKVVVVLGHGADEIEAALRAQRFAPTIQCVRNDRPDLANGVSVLVGADVASATFVLTMADHVLGDEVMRLAAAHEPPADGATLLIDRRVDGVFDLDDATKVATDGDRIRHIGKALADYDAIDVGVFLVGPALVAALRETLSENGDASLSSGVQRLAARGLMRVLDIAGGFWQDVDTPEMLAHAESVLSSRRR